MTPKGNPARSTLIIGGICAIPSLIGFIISALITAFGTKAESTGDPWVALGIGTLAIVWLIIVGIGMFVGLIISIRTMLAPTPTASQPSATPNT